MDSESWTSSSIASMAAEDDMSAGISRLVGRSRGGAGIGEVGGWSAEHREIGGRLVEFTGTTCCTSTRTASRGRSWSPSPRCGSSTSWTSAITASRVASRSTSCACPASGTWTCGSTTYAGRCRRRSSTSR
uniref:Uncharacterized protein n=1 Tax=Zea mays TaxID=4577 RepID=C4IZX7_MAIZE|nr:unknown [Zea mays]